MGPDRFAVLLGGWLLHEGFPRRLAGGWPPRSAVFLWSDLALRHASAVQVTTFGCFTGMAACLPFAAQLLSQLGAPYNPRGHNLRRARPSRHGDQRARRMTTGTVDLVREDY